VSNGDARLEAHVERLHVAIDSLKEQVAILAANTKHMEAEQAKDHDLIFYILKTLRGDEKGSGGFTSRIAAIENEVKKLVTEKASSNARVWQVVAAVIGALLIRAVAAKVFGGEGP